MVKLNQNMVMFMGQSIILHLDKRRYKNCFQNISGRLLIHQYIALKKKKSPFFFFSQQNYRKKYWLKKRSIKKQEHVDDLQL